ncbi:cytochrome P450 [Glycomyces albidus]|jgi:cytochrome P450|uniref:Cytochrome P450 n=1 Tax=Glycomyces albidus TaxID=2656774 RepID=A0A6L5GAM4_9ACTN|nr:cytochrome P450 [Glycomyces albidus]MQM26620.1 cytochrome P450 [Glycomyces albidus]
MSQADTLPFGMPYRKESRYDPPAALLDLQAVPVRRIRYHPDGVEGWLVTGYDEAKRALADVRWSSAADPVRSPIDLPGFHDAGRPVTPGFFNFFDPPEHTRIRRKLTGSFTLRRMRALEAHVGVLVDRHIEAMKAKGAPADLVTDFALPVPALVIGEMLGVPDEDRERFHTASAEVVDMTLPFERRGQVMMELFGYLAGLVPGKREHPGPDILSDLAADPELGDDEICGMAALLLLAGHETTANMLALGTFALLEHPDQMALLRADPALMPGAVEELLRYLTILHIGRLRVASEDFEFEGHRIRAGDHVTISLQAANRDPSRFPDPHALDVTRDAQGHLAFGFGVHQCIGHQLARIEMRIGFAKLLAAFPGLALAVPSETIPLRSDMVTYGVHTLPVAW